MSHLLDPTQIKQLNEAQAAFTAPTPVRKQALINRAAYLRGFNAGLQRSKYAPRFATDAAQEAFKLGYQLGTAERRRTKLQQIKPVKRRS